MHYIVTLNFYRYNDSNQFGITPLKPSDKIRKPHFLSQQPQRSDYNGYGNGISSESKLPPSLRWALEEDNDSIHDSPQMYHRNSKANAHLAPLGNNAPAIKNPLYKHGSNITASANTIYGGNEVGSIERIPSIKKLSSQKTRRLQPLRK